MWSILFHHTYSLSYIYINLDKISSEIILFFRFYLQLIVSYELYINKSYKESYLEIENVVKFMETCKYDESNEQYSDAYNHIARATLAYIALTLQIDSEKVNYNYLSFIQFNIT